MPDFLSPDLQYKLNPQVCHGGYHKAEPGWLSSPRQCLLACFDLWYVAAGAGGVRIDGQWVDFAAGQLVCIKPGQDYQQERADERDPFEVYFVHVHLFDAPDDPDKALLMRHWPPVLNIWDQGEMRRAFVAALTAITTDRSGHILRAKAALLQILAGVFDSLRVAGHQNIPRVWPQVMAARRFIETSYARRLTLEQIAEHAGLSASYLTMLFRRHLGMAPIAYLIDYRLRQSRLLLAQGQSVSAVAHQTGFASLHYFSRLFKQHFGAAPTEFAHSCRL